MNSVSFQKKKNIQNTLEGGHVNLEVEGLGAGGQARVQCVSCAPGLWASAHRLPPSPQWGAGAQPSRLGCPYVAREALRRRVP